MTHSLEVLGIAEFIADQVNKKCTPNSKFGKKVCVKIVSSIALLHYVEHTPYGHIGESELNRLCNSYIDNLETQTKYNFNYNIYRGYKHNLQGVLILDRIDTKIIEALSNIEKSFQEY